MKVNLGDKIVNIEDLMTSTLRVRNEEHTTDKLFVCPVPEKDPDPSYALARELMTPAGIASPRARRRSII